MEPIIKLLPNESIWFDSGWEQPSQRFKIEAIPLRFIFLTLLAIMLFWFGISYAIGQSIYSEWILFITLIIWLGSIVFFSYPSNDKQLIPLSFFMLPPTLSIIFSVILQQPKIGIGISTLYLITILFYWGKLVALEIENEPILVLLSSISLFISFITLVFELLPTSLSNSIYDVYPFFAPVIIFWTNTTFMVIRAIAGIIIFIAAFAMAITFVISEGLIKDVDKIVFHRVNELTSKSLINPFLNSLVKFFNAIIIPSSEVIIFTIVIIFVYVVTTVVYFFRSLIFNIIHVSVAISYRFFRFVVLPVGLAGFILYLLYSSASEINYYIHFQNITPVQFVLKLIATLFILPFVFLFCQRASTILKDLQLYLTIIILPNVWLYLLLVIITSALVLLNIKPYTFGILSWISGLLWAFGSFFIITLFFKKKNTT